jgi:MOSC domain-containing protein YiiM
MSGIDSASRRPIQITGLRNPCLQIDRLEDGLLRELVGRDEDARRRAQGGVMAIVLGGGTVGPGDALEVTLPAAREPLLPV